MANRDLFGGEFQRTEERHGGALASRLVLQGLVAAVMFAGVVALYEQEGRLGEGVRYVVALARADQQEVLAVNSLADVDWQGLVAGLAGDEQQDVTGVAASADVADDENVGADVTDVGADEDVAPSAGGQGDTVLVLPASGLMQAAFGDLGADGLTVDGLEIYCQQEQTVKAAAAGRVLEAAAGEIRLEHAGGLETLYTGALEPDVAAGDEVQQGQVIGRLPEGVLTFKLLVEGEPVDPLGYVLGPE